jgi:hypothetical protein
VVRVGATDGLDDVPLGHLVDLGDEIVASLGADPEGGHSVDVADDQVSRAAGGADGDVQ